MSDHDTIPELEQRLPIRIRTIVAGNGDVREAHSVYCPQQAKSVSLDECLFCERVNGAAFDPTTGKFVLSCVLVAPSIPD